MVVFFWKSSQSSSHSQTNLCTQTPSAGLGPGGASSDCCLAWASHPTPTPFLSRVESVWISEQEQRHYDTVAVTGLVLPCSHLYLSGGGSLCRKAQGMEQKEEFSL